MRYLRRADVSSVVFWALFLLLLGGAATLDRSEWPLIGDEATYRMQAESLAWDFDLRYTAEDHQRFLDLHGFIPEGLILQSKIAATPDAPPQIVYGKPFFYAAYLAPWVRVAPERGPFVANTFLLLLAAFCTARTLRRRLSYRAPLWVALCVFGSTAFAQVFWVHTDLFLACLTALAFSLLLGSERSSRWFVIGALLAVVGYSRPMYLSLLLPAAVFAAGAPAQRWKIWKTERGPIVLRLVAGSLAVILLTALVHQALAESWTSYGGTRRGFYSYTGFPNVDFPAHEWQSNLKEWGNHAWVDPAEVVKRKKIVGSLWAWNGVYFFFGRHVGLVPYFIPLFLAFACRPRRRLGWSVLLATLLTVAAFLWLRPFNFWGGGASLGNRYFLPLYPMFWFLPREIGVKRLAFGALVAGVFLWPLWSAPRDFPLRGPEGTRYVSETAQRFLPYETTQNHLKPGGEDTLHGGLWIKFLDRDTWAVREGEALRVRGRAEVTHLLFGSRPPLGGVIVEAALPEGATLEVVGMGAEGVVEPLEDRGAWSRWRVEILRPRARHPMWWEWNPYNLYVLELRPGGTKSPIPVRLHPESLAPGPRDHEGS